ncbi:hypothetical protein Sste5346_003347 [Sporothrix stenoceras]|uniref:Uncharacterized protein n=1 Tax=Sporothrix stenoceras TaxID=5173 RepID=A0ABR3ZFW7_9PEZI
MSDTSDVDGDVVDNPVNTDVAEDTDTAENTNNVGSDGEIDDNGGGGAAAAIEAGSDAGSEAGNSAAGGNEWSLEYNATFRCALCRFPFEKGDAFHVGM